MGALTLIWGGCYLVVCSALYWSYGTCTSGSYQVDLRFELFSGVFPSKRRGFPARDGAALSLRHGKCAQKSGDTISDTISVDVPTCSERAERRASALARRPRATA